MIRSATIFLSVVGLAVGLWAVATADERKPDIPLARPASVNPFARGVAALGVIEPAERTVGLVAPEPGLVMQVLVKVGDKVEAGAPLLVLDSRRLDADLVRARAAVAAGEAEVARWHALPRPEDLPPLEAAVTAARAAVQDREEQLALTRQAFQRGSGTDRDISRATFALEAAKADAQRSQAELERARAGGWRPDLTIAEAKLAGLRAEVEALTLLKERLTVRSPRAGRIIRRQVEAGEFASTDSTRPALLLADLEHLHVRAQVDEEDIALITAAASRGPVRAVAMTRGAMVMELPLEFDRIEPFARPKTDLMGVNAERVDTRVVDVVFRVAGAPAQQVFPGQAVDVFVDEGGAP
jgi:HlyD family secretion protein